MIKNDRQYTAAKRAADAFAASLADSPQTAPAQSEIHPRFIVAEREAITAQLDDLRAELRAYDELRSGDRRVIEIRNWAEVPKALIEGRIAAGLTQRDLGVRLDLPEQAIQRYEANDYASASLKRLQEVAAAIGVSLAGLAAVDEPTPKQLLNRVKELGIDTSWLFERLLPKPVSEIIQSFSERRNSRAKVNAPNDANGMPSVGTALVQAAEIFRRVFDISAGQLFGNTPLMLDLSAIGSPRFKRAARKPKKGADAYTFYAHYIALLALKASSSTQRRPLPRTAPELVRGVRAQFGSLNFETSVRYLWNYGIPVVPLADVGAFHGACWRTGGREVIVLKQRTPSADRWLYDLWHEVGHIVDEPDADRFAIVEDEVPAADDPKEQSAMKLAGDVVLDGRADELAQAAMKAVDNNILLLSRILPRLARENNVSVGALANHLAFRIAQDSDGKINWWGTAAKLQTANGSPWRIARDVFLENADFDNLIPSDRDLLTRALSEPLVEARSLGA